MKWEEKSPIDCGTQTMENNRVEADIHSSQPSSSLSSVSSPNTSPKSSISSKSSSARSHVITESVVDLNGKINQGLNIEEEEESAKTNGIENTVNSGNLSSALISSIEVKDNELKSSKTSSTPSSSPIKESKTVSNQCSSTCSETEGISLSKPNFNSTSVNMNLNIPNLNPNPSFSPKSSFKLTKSSSTSPNSIKNAINSLMNTQEDVQPLPPAVEVTKLFFKPIPEPIQSLNPFKRIGRKAPEFILSGIDIHIPRGKIYCLIGPSGCGKTTLLRCVVGVLNPTAGDVRVFGYKPHQAGGGIPGPKVGYMPQESALYQDLTVEEVLIYFGKLNCCHEKDIKKRTDFLLTFLDMNSCRKQLVANISGGQNRRVSLAAALIHTPPLLILDEPTAGVDPLLRSSIWKHLRVLTRKEGITVIITTHYVEEARQADIVGLMRKGLLLAQESPKSLLQRNGVKTLEDAFLKLCTDLLVQKRDSKLLAKQMERQLSQEIAKSVKNVNGDKKAIEHDNPTFIRDEIDGKNVQNVQNVKKQTPEDDETQNGSSCDLKTNMIRINHHNNNNMINKNDSIIQMDQSHDGEKEGNKSFTKSDSTRDKLKNGKTTHLNQTKNEDLESNLDTDLDTQFTVVVDSSPADSLRRKEKVVLRKKSSESKLQSKDDREQEQETKPKDSSNGNNLKVIKIEIPSSTITSTLQASSVPSPTLPSPTISFSPELDSILSPRERKLSSFARYWLVVLALFWKNWIRNKRHFEVILFQFFMPVVVVILFCYCIGGIPRNIQLAIVNEECPHGSNDIQIHRSLKIDHKHPNCAGKQSQLFIRTIDDFIVEKYEYTHLSDALAAVKSGYMWAVMHIPANFSKALEKRIMFAAIDDENEIDKEDENATIRQSTILIHADLTEKVISITMQRSLDDSFLKFTQLALAEDGYNPNIMRPPIMLGTPVYGNDDKHRGYTEFMAPGILINISFVMAAGLTALVFLMDRRDGTLERHFVCGISATQILIAHVWIRLISMAMASAIVLALVCVWLELPTRGPVYWTFLLLLLQSCAGMSYGMLVSSICKYENTAAFLISSTVVANLTLCGMIWPIEGVPYYIRWVSYLMPSTLPTESLRGLLNRGWSVEHLSVQLGFISTIAWFIVFTFLAAKLFKFYK